jgi:hypothetical protein
MMAEEDTAAADRQQRQGSRAEQVGTVAVPLARVSSPSPPPMISLFNVIIII